MYLLRQRNIHFRRSIEPEIQESQTSKVEPAMSKYVIFKSTELLNRISLSFYVLQLHGLVSLLH